MLTIFQNDSKPPTLGDIPKLTKAMVQGEPEEATEAAERLYQLCDVAHKHNREPMVATGKYDVLNPLAMCLLHDNPEKLHLVCLTLNNLAIPHDNKRVMCLERISKKLLGNLCKVIASGRKEAYLCIICLMNLSFYEPAEAAIGQFAPKENNNLRNWRTKIPPLQNPNSLLRILQELTAHAARGTADFRWAFGLLASLAKHPDNALLIGLTAIPKVAIENVRLAKDPPSEWKVNSLEDFSLFLILHLAETSDQGLQGALEVAESIMKSDTGVQGLKATMICALLEAPWSTFPNYGVVASASVAELMENAFLRRGKKNTYDNNVFRLKTAVKAYGDLARSAAKADEADEDTNDYSNTKVVALPTAVALLFQIISQIIVNCGEDEDDDGPSEFLWDVKIGELAVSAITSLLPALLKYETQVRHSANTEAACAEFGRILNDFSAMATSGLVKERAAEAGEKISHATHSALPLLEASYDLWKQMYS